MQRSNRTELCNATKNRKQSRFETHLGSDATLTDSVLNNAIHVATGCLCPTPTDYFANPSRYSIS